MAERKRAIVFLADGSEEVEAITQIDFLRRAEIEVVVAGVGALEVTGGHAIRITADALVEDVPEDVDAVVIPGGMPGASNIASSERATQLIKSVFAAGRLVAAICAAPAVVLEPNGVLSGRRFTCFPGYEEQVSSGKFSTDRVVLDGNLLTSRGAGTAAEFAVEIIRYLAGDGAADEVRDRTLVRS
jgi:4-methyl-5(b-hydroxyethyl)-thiazole monophosphate biosynthesis